MQLEQLGSAESAVIAARRSTKQPERDRSCCSFSCDGRPCLFAPQMNTCLVRLRCLRLRSGFGKMLHQVAGFPLEIEYKECKSSEPKSSVEAWTNGTNPSVCSSNHWGSDDRMGYYTQQPLKPYIILLQARFWHVLRVFCLAKLARLSEHQGQLACVAVFVGLAALPQRFSLGSWDRQLSGHQTHWKMG